MEEDQMKEESNTMCSGKAIIAIIIFAVAIVAAVVVIVVLVLKTGNNMNSYYLSDVICESESVCYRKINVNMEHYISELNETVLRTHVRYENRYGIEIAADLYTPKNLDKSKKYPAIVIGPPYGGVKEQGPSVYANQLAWRGYVCLAFDPSFNGESGGKKRKVSSSDIFVEDFSAGVDYLGTLSYVDREKIGGIGICGSGGFLLGAAAIDSRIKAVVTVVMYDIPKEKLKADKDWADMQNRLENKRWADVDNGNQECKDFYIPDREYEDGKYPVDPENSVFDNTWRPFYSTKRGHHPRSTGGFTTTSDFSLANLQVTDNIEKIAPRPIFFISCDSETDSKAYTKEAYEKVKDKYTTKKLREIHYAPGTDHIDLYDKIDKIPFDDIDDFFQESFE